MLRLFPSGATLSRSLEVLAGNALSTLLMSGAPSKVEGIICIDRITIFSWKSFPVPTVCHPSKKATTLHVCCTFVVHQQVDMTALRALREISGAQEYHDLWFCLEGRLPAGLAWCSCNSVSELTHPGCKTDTSWFMVHRGFQTQLQWSITKPSGQETTLALVCYSHPIRCAPTDPSYP